MNVAYTLTLADPDRWGHMDNDPAWMWIWGAMMMLIWIAAIGAAVWLVLRTMDRTTPPTEHRGAERARDILAERYARGEINTDEYEERLANSPDGHHLAVPAEPHRLPVGYVARDLGTHVEQGLTGAEAAARPAR